MDYINLLRVTAVLVTFIAHITEVQNQVFAALGSRGFVFEMPAWAAMWIFFSLSGYLAGTGFASGRYRLDKKDILRFYKRKVTKIYFPTLFFILFCFTFVYPEIIPQNPKVIWRFLFCLYTPFGGDPNGHGFGVTWYVFTLMWLYAVAPFLSWIAQFISRKFGPRALLFVCGFCLVAGAVWRMYAYWAHLDWLAYVYSPAYSNLDMFSAGIFMGYYICTAKGSEDCHTNKIPKAGAIAVMYTAILLCCWILYQTWICNNEDYRVSYFIYQYFGQTIFTCLTLAWVFVFSTAKQIPHIHTREPARLLTGPVQQKFIFAVNSFANISFEFYLFHTLVRGTIYEALYDVHPLQYYLRVMVATFVLTILFAKMFSLSCRCCREAIRPGIE